MPDTLTLPHLSAAATPPKPMANTLSVTDNRTGKSYEVPIADGTIKATDLRQIKTGDDYFGLMTYDPHAPPPHHLAAIAVVCGV